MLMLELEREELALAALGGSYVVMAGVCSSEASLLLPRVVTIISLV